MIRRLVLVLALLPAATFAGKVYKDGDMEVRLLTAPCEGRVAEMAEFVKATPMFSARVNLRERVLEACWKLLDKENILILDEDGDGGKIPIEDFKDEFDS